MLGNPFQERVRLAGGSTKKDPSAEIWRHYKPQEFKLYQEDFATWDGSVSSNVGTYYGESGSWRSYEDTGATILPLATEVDGVLRLTLDTTDNDSASIQLGSTTSVQIQPSRGVTTAGTDKVCMMEARVRVTLVADNYNLFVGMMEEGSIADSFFVDAGGAVIDKDFIGFAVHEDDGNALDVEYKTSGQTLDNTSDVFTLVAATWYKLGWIYRPTDPVAERIKFYVDGAEQSDARITATNMAAATFPDEQEMGFVMGIGGTGTAVTVDLDWVAIAQEM